MKNDKTRVIGWDENDRQVLGQNAKPRSSAIKAFVFFVLCAAGLILAAVQYGQAFGLLAE